MKEFLAIAMIMAMQNQKYLRGMESFDTTDFRTKSFSGGHRLTEEEIHATLPGRNEPCHCGSGIKYKKCCLRNGGKNHGDSSK